MIGDGGAVALGEPPPFGAGGAWPPLESPAIVVATATFHTAPRPGRASGEYQGTLARWSGLSTTTKVVTGTLAGTAGLVLWPFAVTGAVAGLGYMGVKKTLRKIRTGKAGELREIVYSQAWGRDDPIVQLPPGAAHEHSYSMTFGISETQSRELGQSLGLKLGKEIKLTGELSSKFGIAATISEQQSVTDTVTLRNSGTHAYRLYARWFVRHEIKVQRIEIPEGIDWQEILKGTSGPYERTILCKVSFMSPASAVLTHCEIEK
jgi:hypothetical protein